MKKYNLSRKIVHVKTFGAARFWYNNIVIRYECNILKNMKNKNVILKKM